MQTITTYINHINKYIRIYSIYIFGLFLGICIWMSMLGYSNANRTISTKIPTYDSDFAKSITTGPERVYAPSNIGISSPYSSTRQDIKSLITKLFYPNSDISSDGGILYRWVRNIGIGILFLFLVINGMRVVWYGDSSDKIEGILKNFIYIGIGAGLVFGVTRIVNALGIVSIPASTSAAGALATNLQNSILFQVLVFLRTMAFFVAIIMIVYYGIKIIRGMDDDSKLKNLRNGIINTIGALAFMKVIDYAYYVAQDSNNFRETAKDAIIEISKLLGYIVGFLALFYVIYSGFMLVLGGDEERFKKTTNVFKTIFLIVLIVGIFLLIVYQIFNDFYSIA